MLHRYFLLLPGLLAALGGVAQPTRPTVRPPLTTVTAYLNGMALEHQTTLTLTAGLNRVLLSGLSPSFDDESLEVQLGDGAELVSLDFDDDENAPTPPTLNPAAADSLARDEAEVRSIEGELLGLQQEKSFLLANQTLPTGTQANWSAEVQKGATLMRTRLPAIQLETTRLQKRLDQLKTEVALLSPRAREVGNQDHLLLIRAARAGTVPLTVGYYLTNKRSIWMPKLEIKADAAGRELQFITRGRLRNPSGLDWNKVRVVLMHYSVDDHIARPTMAPWTLDFDGGDHIGEGRIDSYVVKGTAKGKPAEQSQGTRYEVPGPVTMRTGQRREFSLPAVRLAARPEYLAIPRLSEHVFLQAKVAGWQGLHLASRANVYHAGAYVGDVELDEEAYNDSLEVALGHDEQLVVGRAKLEDFSSNAGLSGKRRVRLSYELNVQNRHPETVRLRLQDQIPVSEEAEIKVKLLDSSGAQLDERSGKLTWLLTLPPGSNQRLRFSFQVDYPQDKPVEIINHRVRISNPKFR
jgi:hypothetical protein